MGGGVTVDPVAEVGSAPAAGAVPVLPTLFVSVPSVAALLPVGCVVAVAVVVPVVVVPPGEVVLTVALVLLTLVAATPATVDVAPPPPDAGSGGPGAAVVTGAVTVGDVVVGDVVVGSGVAAVVVTAVVAVGSGAVVVPGSVVVGPVVVAPVVVAPTGVVETEAVVEPGVVVVSVGAVVPEAAMVCVAEAPWFATCVCVRPLQSLMHPETWICPITWTVVLVTTGGVSACAAAATPRVTAASVVQNRNSRAGRSIAIAGHSSTARRLPINQLATWFWIPV